MSPVEIAWTVAGIIVPAIVGLGFGAVGLAPPEFKFARGCFWFSAILLGAMDVFWDINTEHSLIWRIVVGGLVGAMIFILLPEGLRFVAKREFSSHPTEPPPQQPAPSPATTRPEPAAVPKSEPRKVERVKPKTEPPKPPAGNEKPPTLESLFTQDFPYTLKSTFGGIDFRAANGFELPIKRQIYMDFEGESKFVGFYVPAAGPDNDYDYSACMHLVAWVEKTIADFEKDHFVSGGTPGQMTTAADLKFSGRVLLYVGDDLSIEQEADIIKTYKTAGFDVQFRGPDYLSSRVAEWWREHGKSN